MRKILSLILIIMTFFCLSVPTDAFTIIYDGKTEEYPWEPITMRVDGETVTTQMPPISLNGRTLVPAREFFEQIGATVSWQQESKRVIVEYNDERIVLTIDSRTVFVGSNSVQISSEDPPPKIINDKTMIPVRLVSEAFGFGVEWENDTRTVVINTNRTESTPLMGVTLAPGKDVDEVFVTMENPVEPEILNLYNPRRIVLDFYGVKGLVSDGSITKGGGVTTAVRYSQHTDKYRVVIDLSAECDVELENSGNGILVILTRNEDYEYVEKPTDSVTPTEPSEEPTQNVTFPEGMTVIVDAGHGGSDPGAMYPAGSSNPVVKEKDITLAVALKVRDYLISNGVNVIMTRDSDTYPSLKERVEIANASNADLFVSVHCNAMDNKDSIDGAQVYYYGSSAFGKKLATLVYDKLIEYTGMTKRGIQDGSTLYVIKNSKMPAILTENGFISNAHDRKYMMSSEGQTQIARAIADGVLEALKLL